MKNWRNLVAGVVLSLATAASPIFARAYAYPATPQPIDPAAFLIEEPEVPPPAENVPQVSAEKSGTIAAKDGGTLRLNLQLGNVHVFTDESAEISYRAVVETDSRDAGSEEFLRQFNVTARQTASGVTIDAKVPWQTLHGRFSAEMEIHIPRRYNLDATTGGGNMDVADIDGRVRLSSAGGNITVGRVGGDGTAPPAGKSAVRKSGGIQPDLSEAARIETQGGRISVGNVAGTLRADTAGGHVMIGDIAGDAIVRTGGGQIHAGHIAGTASLDSGGGNIQIESPGSSVTADAAGGSLTVRQAGAPLQIKATDSDITAWLSAQKGLRSAADSASTTSRQSSQLSSTGGDIVLYLPRKLAATIDATIDQAIGRQIAADPSLPLKISARDSLGGGRILHCAAQLNGGGEVVHLRTTAGNIVLRQGDPDAEPAASASSAVRALGGMNPIAAQNINSNGRDAFADADGFFAEMRRRILESWWGGVPVKAEEMQKHLEHSVAPVYPDVARQAGVEGNVVLRVYVSGNGRVTGIKVLDGPPILARAAVQAVQQWRYQGPRIDGRPDNVVTTLIVSFRLH